MKRDENVLPMLTEEYEMLLRRLLLAAAEAAPGAIAFEHHVGSAIANELAGDNDREINAARVANKLLHTALRQKHLRQASKVVTPSLLELPVSDRGKSARAHFLSTIARNAAKNPGLLLADAEKLSVGAGDRAKKGKSTWLDGFSNALLGEAPEEDYHTVVLFVLGGVTPHEATLALAAAKTENPRSNLLVGGTSFAPSSQLLNALYNQ
ncbi:hypothetical protein DIPPA_10172 [Diplonema papillatum]|nr:hypothetical protein DIPPA_10172 [Diplonema papillatum]